MARRKAPDPKLDALRKHKSLHETPEKVRDELFSSNDFFDARDLVQVRYEMLRRVRVDEQSISEVAATFGVSRPTFYQAQRAFECQGVVGLLPQKPGPRRAHKLDENVVEFLKQCVAKNDRLKAADLAVLVQNHLGLSVHPTLLPSPHEPGDSLRGRGRRSGPISLPVAPPGDARSINASPAPGPLETKFSIPCGVHSRHKNRRWLAPRAPRPSWHWLRQQGFARRGVARRADASGCRES